MLELISIACLIAAITLLGILSVIDLRVRLLPNELVAGFMTCGLIFHSCTLFAYASLGEMGLGALLGGGTLYLIRGIANKIHGTDTLGLGDVKLLAAAGVWLGPYYILIAMTIGAVCGIAHGLFYALYLRHKSGVMPLLRTLSLPAGPGFSFGIIVTGVYAFRDFPDVVLFGLSF